MTDEDFNPEGWSAFDDHGSRGEKGKIGNAVIERANELAPEFAEKVGRWL